ncbi:MAG: response regulator transcription factor [Candidatus Kapabacteria bacterium]|nr:response regulator transcription factor [Candidatus Kapabacteria bacterium]
MSIRIYIVDDHPLIIDGLKVNIERFASIEVVGTHTDPERALDEIRSRRDEIDVVLLDISMPRLGGPEFSRRLKKENTRPFVIFLTYLTDEYTVSQIADTQHDGLFHKTEPVDALVEYIRALTSGTAPVTQLLPTSPRSAESANQLTPTEIIVLYYVAVKGLTSREIADIMSRSELTIVKHRKNIMFKLDIHNIQGLVWYAISKDMHVNPPV